MNEGGNFRYWVWGIWNWSLVRDGGWFGHVEEVEESRSNIRLTC